MVTEAMPVHLGEAIEEQGQFDDISLRKGKRGSAC
jgi:hypothetical protein